MIKSYSGMFQELLKKFDYKHVYHTSYEETPHQFYCDHEILDKDGRVMAKITNEPVQAEKDHIGSYLRYDGLRIVVENKDALRPIMSVAKELRGLLNEPIRLAYKPGKLKKKPFYHLLRN